MTPATTSEAPAPLSFDELAASFPVDEPNAKKKKKRKTENRDGSVKTGDEKISLDEEIEETTASEEQGPVIEIHAEDQAG
jgi:hypothetical protein